MQPVRDSFTVRQGSYQSRRYQWQQGGVTVDLTGATAKLQFRKSVKADLFYEMSTENGLIEVDPIWVNLKFTSESTAAIQTQNIVRTFGHLEVTLANGRTYRIVEIEMLFDPEITRP